MRIPGKHHFVSVIFLSISLILSVGAKAQESSFCKMNLVDEEDYYVRVSETLSRKHETKLTENFFEARFGQYFLATSTFPFIDLQMNDGTFSLWEVYSHQDKKLIISVPYEFQGYDQAIAAAIEYARILYGAVCAKSFGDFSVSMVLFDKIIKDREQFCIAERMDNISFCNKDDNQRILNLSRELFDQYGKEIYRESLFINSYIYNLISFDETCSAAEKIIDFYGLEIDMRKNFIEGERFNCFQ
ncbi:MAG: hypothetical protein WDZ84_10000 [Rhodovibrionaceae bacterium]